MKDIALHIMDIAQNSIRAGSDSIIITTVESPDDNRLTVTVADNGKGMDEETLQKADDPYFTSRKTRRVGMGLPLLKMNATISGGDMKITSSPASGTTVTACFGYHHIDRPPLGDIPGVIALLITANPSLNIVYSHAFNLETWSISTHEISEALDGAPVNDLRMVRYLKEIIGENLKEIKTSKPDMINIRNLVNQ